MKSLSTARFRITTQVAVLLTIGGLALGSAGQLRADRDDELVRLRYEAIQAAVDRIANAVVQIETLGGLEKVGQVLIGTGPTSGLIVSPDGYVVSSAFNFIQQPSSILVTLPDGQRRPARIVSRDHSRMLVLLKIEVDQAIPLPDFVPREELRVGQTVIAVGKTFDPSQANLSVGILSATNRVWGKAVQTDANISPANYGGPLIDLHGRVIGVLVPLSPESDEEVAGAEWYDSGIGFAVPISLDGWGFTRLKEGQDLWPGKLGIAFANASRLDPPTEIAVVKLNSPAGQAGLKPGDRIVAVNGQPVQRQSLFRHQLGPLYAGQSVELRIERGSDMIDVSLTLTDVIPPYEHAFFGILPARSGEETGVGVRYVFTSSPAADAGLAVGDLILQIDDRDVADSDAMRQLLATLQPDQSVTVRWRRGDQPLSANIRLGRLPTDVPDRLPAAEPAADPQPLTTGTVAIEIPEDPNRCTAYVPEVLKQGVPAGLLVLLPRPGESEVETLIEHWRTVSETFGLVLLLPEPQEAARWQPTEAAFVRKVIEKAVNRYAVADQRVAIFGEEAGGAMAFLVGFRHRDVVRGIATLDAPLPGRVSGIENEPLQRLAILNLLTPASPLKERIDAQVEALRELKFPVSQIERQAADEQVTEAERQLIGRWVDTLDRL